MSLQWNNQYAIKEYKRMESLLGTPSTVSPNPEGIAIWSRSDLEGKQLFGTPVCFNEIIIRDEEIKHLCPREHRDFLYSTVIIAVEPRQVPMLYAISGSVSYDALKNSVSARCASIEANIATLKLATDLLLGNNVEYRDQNIKYHDLESVHTSGAYGSLIGATKDEAFAKNLYAELCANVSKLSSPNKLNKGFWRGAFSVQDGECFPPDKPDKAHLPNKEGGNYYPNKPNKANQSMREGYCPDKPDKASQSMREGYHPDKPDKASQSMREGYRPDKPDKASQSMRGGYYKKYNKYKAKYLGLKNTKYQAFLI